MRTLVVAAMLTLAAGTSEAGLIDWTDWTSASADLSSAAGTVGGVGIDYTGTLVFAQLDFGVMVGAGASAVTDYWIEGVPAPYTGNAVVDNRPPGFELLAMNLDSFNRIVFDTPVVDPVMAIVSQGRLDVSVTYDFDQPFTVLSEGRGFWGDGFFALGPGDVLVGNELHAVIQFEGEVSEINWFSTEEFWHGFTIGVPRAAPEPGTFALVTLGLAGVIARRRR